MHKSAIQRTMVVVHDKAAENAKKLPAALHTLAIDPKLFDEAGLGHHGMAHNPSIVVHEGKLIVVIRVIFVDTRINHNILGTVDEKWRLRDARIVADKTDGLRNKSGLTHGFEDLRLFCLNEKLTASATVCDRVQGDPRPKIAVLDLDTNGDILRAHVQPSDRHEKNWMPVIDDEGLRFVYSVQPHVVLDYDELSHEVSPAVSTVELGSPIIRGGSQIVPYEGGFLGIIHEVHRHFITGYAYLHRLVLFDRQLRCVRMSDFFYFRDVGVEFCAGLAEWNDNFVASFGAADREACLAVIHRDVVRRMVNP